MKFCRNLFLRMHYYENFKNQLEEQNTSLGRIPKLQLSRILSWAEPYIDFCFLGNNNNKLYSTCTINFIKHFCNTNLFGYDV